MHTPRPTGHGRRTSSTTFSLAVAVAALAGCGSGSPSTTSPTPASVAGPSITSPAATLAPAAGRTVAVTFAAGRVSGDVGRVQVAVGSVVNLIVSSDVADEVHLHGYDKSVDVPAGGTATLRFAADIPGVFEVELEKLGQHLLELQVS